METQIEYFLKQIRLITNLRNNNYSLLQHLKLLSYLNNIQISNVPELENIHFNHDSNAKINQKSNQNFLNKKTIREEHKCNIIFKNINFVNKKFKINKSTSIGVKDLNEEKKSKNLFITETNMDFIKDEKTF